MLRRALLGLALLLLIPALGIPLWVASHGRDLPDPGDADLVSAVAQVADSDNGYAHLVRASELSALGGEDETRVRALLTGEQRDDLWLERELRDNRAAVEELERAATAPAMVLPEPRFAVQGDALHPLLHAQTLVRLASLAARREPRRVTAFERSLLGLRLGAAVSRASDPELISAIIAIALESLSLREARLALDGALLDDETSLRLTRELEVLRTPPDAWRRVWAGEYQFFKAELRSAPAVPLPNRSLALIAERDRALGRLFAEPCERGHDALGSLPSGDAAVFEKFNLRRCHAEARLALLEVEIALRAHGVPPPSLEALVPRYLDRVPVDPFDGAPLRYDHERGLVYSVGSKFVANGVWGPPSPDDEREPAIYARDFAAPASGARAARR